MKIKTSSWVASGLVVLCASLQGATAGAQEQGPRKAAPVASAPSSTESSPAAPPAPSPEVIAEAKQRFDRGFELYNEGEYPLALIEFNRAYELVPNYKVLYNIGQVCIQLGQYANARRALEEYLQQGGATLPEDRRKSVTADLQMLERRTAFLLITSNVPQSEVLVDEVVVGKTPLEAPLLVDAGVHRVTLRSPGYQQRVSRVTLAGGDEQTLAVTLELVPEEKPTIVVREREVASQGPGTLVIAGWVTTGALVTGAVVTGIMGASQAKDLDQLRRTDPSEFPDGGLAERMQSTKNKASSLLLASDVLSGAALLVGGASLWFTLNPPERPAPPADREPVPPKEVQVGLTQGQLSVRGSF